MSRILQTVLSKDLNDTTCMRLGKLVAMNVAHDEAKLMTKECVSLMLQQMQGVDGKFE